MQGVSPPTVNLLLLLFSTICLSPLLVLCPSLLCFILFCVWTIPCVGFNSRALEEQKDRGRGVPKRILVGKKSRSIHPSYFGILLRHVLSGCDLNWRSRNTTRNERKQKLARVNGGPHRSYVRDYNLCRFSLNNPCVQYSTNYSQRTVRETKSNRIGH